MYLVEDNPTNSHSLYDYKLLELTVLSVNVVFNGFRNLAEVVLISGEVAHLCYKNTTGNLALTNLCVIADLYTIRDVPGQLHKSLSYPDVAAWQRGNTILPVQSAHHVKVSSLGGAIAGWSVSHSHSSDIPNLQRRNNSHIKDIFIHSQQTRLKCNKCST